MSYLGVRHPDIAIPASDLKRHQRDRALGAATLADAVALGQLAGRIDGRNDGAAPGATTLSATTCRDPATRHQASPCRIQLLEVACIDTAPGESSSGIHEPTDSSLLLDCVRVLTRWLREARAYIELPFTNHLRRAKRRALAIQHAAKAEQCMPLYRDLVKVAENTVEAARLSVERLTQTYPRERSTRRRSMSCTMRSSTTSSS